jgi:hypothetical protein
LCIGRRICQSERASKQRSGYAGHCWFRLVRRQQNALAWDQCRRQTPKKTLRLRKSEPRNRRNDLLHAPMTPWPVQHGGRVELPQRSSRPERPSVLRVRADCGSRFFTAKLGVAVHYLPHQLLDHLLANGAVLTLPPPIPVQRSHGFTRPTTRRGAECAPPTVKPLYLPTYFRLAASGSRGKAAADNQSLRLHRPQATVSPTAVS